jgi:hypothetical protein
MASHRMASHRITWHRMAWQWHALPTYQGMAVVPVAAARPLFNCRSPGISAATARCELVLPAAQEAAGSSNVRVLAHGPKRGSASGAYWLLSPLVTSTHSVPSIFSHDFGFPPGAP